MSRPAAHKELVDAIIDSEVDAKEIADRAAELGGTLGQRLNTVMVAVLKARADGKVSAQRARELFMEAYRALSLSGFTKVAQDVKDHAQDSTDRLIKAAEALGPEVHKVEAVRDADKLARAAEKKGVHDGEATE